MYFDPTLLPAVAGVEISLGVILLGVLVYGYKTVPSFFRKFFFLFIGISMFELVTGALWINNHLGTFAYGYMDHSWVMTLGWSVAIWIAYFSYQACSKSYSMKNEFLWTVGGATILCIILELLWTAVGVRAYAPEVQAIMMKQLMVGPVPIQMMLYFPVFLIVVYSFMKYWSLWIGKWQEFSHYTVYRKKDIPLAVLGVVLLAYLIHPLVSLSNRTVFPGIVIGCIVILVLVNYIVSLFSSLSLVSRYSLAVVLGSLGMISLLSIIVSWGGLTFGASIVATYSQHSFIVPGTSLMTVIVGGIILFMSLVIASVKYWKVMTDPK